PRASRITDRQCMEYHVWPTIGTTKTNAHCVVIPSGRKISCRCDVCPVALLVRIRSVQDFVVDNVEISRGAISGKPDGYIGGINPGPLPFIRTLKIIAAVDTPEGAAIVCFDDANVLD